MRHETSVEKIFRAVGTFMRTVAIIYAIFGAIIVILLAIEILG